MREIGHSNSELFLILKIIAIMASKKRKRNDLNLADKVKIINLSKTETIRKLAEQFNWGKSQVANIIKKKEFYLENFASNPNAEAKRVARRTKHEELNIMVLTWFERVRSQNAPVTGPLIQKKALLFS